MSDLTPDGTVVERPGRRSPVMRALTWPISLLLIVGTVVAGNFIIEHTPGSQEFSRPYIHSGAMGTQLDGRTFVATVDGVNGAPSAQLGRRQLTTDGVFVVVSVTLIARQEATHLQHVSVVDQQGRVFSWTRSIDQGLFQYALEPDIPVQGDLLFEVPRDAAPGLKVQLSSDFWRRQNLNQTVIQVDLGISQATVTGWLSARTPLKVAEPKVKA